MEFLKYLWDDMEFRLLVVAALLMIMLAFTFGGVITYFKVKAYNNVTGMNISYADGFFLDLVIVNQ